MNEGRRRVYVALYPLLLVVCAVLFIALRSADDPSRPAGRMTPDDAKLAALSHLRAFDPDRFDSYHVIDAAVYRDVERDAKVWVVICDSTPRSALARAVVVDIDAASGEVIRSRRPTDAEIEEFPIP